MSAKVIGAVYWRLEQWAGGHRDYQITWLIEADYSNDRNETAVRLAIGLPQKGNNYSFNGTDDIFALLRSDPSEWTVEAVQTKDDIGRFWKVIQIFTTRVPDSECVIHDGLSYEINRRQITE
jgi:hypothetical protein